MLALSNKIRSIAILVSLLLTIGASAEASITIAEHYKSRDHFKRTGLELSSDGRRCTRHTDSGQFQISASNEEEDSDACTMLKIARRIHEKIGNCSSKITPEITHETQFGEHSSRLMLSDRAGISFDNPHDFIDVNIHEDCLCGKLVTNKSSVGPGMINVMNLLFDGPYYRVDVTFNAVSADVCMSFFNSKQEKETVLKAYKEFGF